MKKVYISMGVAIGIFVLAVLFLSFSVPAVPENQLGYKPYVTTGNVWYNIVNVAFVVIAFLAVIGIPVGIIIARSVKAYKERRQIKKADRERDERIKKEIAAIRKREENKIKK